MRPPGRLQGWLHSIAKCGWREAVVTRKQHGGSIHGWGRRSGSKAMTRHKQSQQTLRKGMVAEDVPALWKQVRVEQRKCSVIADLIPIEELRSGHRCRG